MHGLTRGALPSRATHIAAVYGEWIGINKYIGTEKISETHHTQSEHGLSEMLEDGYYHKTMTKSFMLISAGMGVGPCLPEWPRSRQTRLRRDQLAHPVTLPPWKARGFLGVRALFYCLGNRPQSPSKMCFL